MNIKLIYSLGSNCSQRVLWALKYKNIKHEVLMSDKMSKEELLAVSPLGKVPALRINDHPLAESMAIIEFLEEKYPQNPLLPKDPYLRAKVREVAEIVNGTIHAVQASKVSKFFIPGISEPDIIGFRKAWIEKCLPSLERVLFQDSFFCVGKEFTLADMFVVPIFTKGLGFKIDAGKYPKYAANIRACKNNDMAWNSCPIELVEKISVFGGI